MKEKKGLEVGNGPLHHILGNLSNKDGDGYENVKKSFIALIPSPSVHQMSAFFFFGFIFLELNSKRLYHCSGKEKESRCFVFTSSRKREIRYFDVVVVQRR